MANPGKKIKKRTDIYSKKKRSEIMRAVKSRDTLLEIHLRELLKDAGLKFQTNVTKLKGKPDIVFKKERLAVFVDGCFWHGCKKHYKMPRSNQIFWENKIASNIKRDIEVKKFYKNMEWDIIRVWEHQLKSNPDLIVRKILKVISPIKFSLFVNKRLKKS